MFIYNNYEKSDVKKKTSLGIYVIFWWRKAAFVSVLAAPHGLQDLSSPTRDWTQATAVETLSPNHWTARELPERLFLFNTQKQRKNP